ncbi:hypothetical protein GCM10023168_30340 [Fodinibacter luteus]|uniref:Uncharacterized protein n=1 Tax=Fodinibacter luteus TaxID=552064 RepID=A0ABP8KN03_9MICO
MDEPGTPEGTLDLGDLRDRWAQCDQVREVARQAESDWDRRLLCARSLDEDRVGAHRVYAAAERYLGIAEENHGALVSLLGTFGATPTVPWNLLRPSFEAAFRALWLLKPEDSQERRRRGVQLEWLDDEAARKYRNVTLRSPDLLRSLGVPDDVVVASRESGRDNTRIYQAEADQLGLRYRTKDWKGRKISPTPFRVVVEGELGKLVPDDAMLTLGFQTTWKTLSGITHSEGSALLRVSDHRTEGAYKGGRQLRMSINDGAFYVAAISTTLLRVMAWSRYGECHQPANRGPVDLSTLRSIVARAIPDS